MTTLGFSIGTKMNRFPIQLVFALLVLVMSCRSAAADEDLWGRWSLRQEHVANDSITAAHGNRHGQIHGPVSFDSTKPNGLNFTGSNAPRNYVSAGEVNDIKLPKQQLTVSAWVKVDKPLEWGGIVGAIQDNGSYERGWLLGYRGSRFSFAVSSQQRSKLTYLTAAGMYEPGNWYHVVGTYDGKLQQLYVDGKLAASSTAQQGDILYSDRGTLSIGAYQDDNEFYGLTGTIEQVSVWSRALKKDDVAADFLRRKVEFPGIDPIAPQVDDWPTYARDNQRTGISADALTFPLELKWKHRAAHRPEPAWPAPAKQDFWHNKQDLKARVTYDRAFHVTTVGDAVYFGSSADDQVYCLDAKSGTVRWRFFAEGPVRLAPTIAKGRVLFGSDDGYVYCLNAANGQLQWKFRLGPSDRRIPGNSRVISVWPIRSSILVEGNTAYFCAGIFPTQGVYQAAVEITTGKKLASGAINVSAQGYLSRRAGRLFTPTGRAPAGAFVAQLSRRGKGVAAELRRIPKESPFAFVGSANARFGGGDGQVAAFRLDDGQKIWSAKIAGKAHSIAIARGRVYVSTDAGVIYCFANAKAENGTNKGLELSACRAEVEDKTREKAAEILRHCQTKLGYCLVVGSGDGHLVRELARQSQLKIIGFETDPKQVESSRCLIADAGLYGRVVIHQASLDADGVDVKLPYTDYLFNLVIDQQKADAPRRVPLSETNRVLRPHGGVAITSLDPVNVTQRAALDGIGEWTHMYANAANTVCSDDELVRGKLALQWFGPPGPRQMLDRHHRTIAPVSKDGRVFIPGNNIVTAADAYNGTVLWSREVPDSRRVGVFRDSSYLVAGKDVVYVASADTCWMLDAQTGEKRREVALPKDSGPRHWGYMANVDDLLIGSTTHVKAARRGHSRQAINDTYYDHRPLVCSDSVFVTDAQSGESLWTYKAESGLIVNPTFAVIDGLIVFVESANAKTFDSPNGRALPSELLSEGSYLVAIDVRTGSKVWRKKYDLSAIKHNAFISGAKGKLVVVGSRNDGDDRKTSRVWYDVHTFDAKTGKLVWKKSQKQPTRIGGSHGEQDHHPVIVGDRLICEPFAYQLDTGESSPNWKWNAAHRRGCGTISASASTFFFRQSNPTMFDLKSNAYSKVTTTTRPGCWINMIPTGGLLLIPEASSGCTCNYAVQTSLAFLPVP